MTQHLTWSLVVPTYMRAHILPRCVKQTLRQSRLPKEIVIVDASPDWENTKSIIQALTAPTDVTLIYQEAHTPSSTAQRNQGISAASADVLFLIDDDSLMYDDCAEEIMKVYEADTGASILGASAMQDSLPPDIKTVTADEQASFSIASPPKQTGLRRFFKKLLDTQSTQFLPYDGDFPSHPVPEHLRDLNIGVIPFMTGSSMTFRRSVFESEQFNELFIRYAAGEDQDLSYRVSRKGLIVNVINARLCHLEISGGRIPQFKVGVLAALNPAVLQQIHSPNRKHTNAQWKRILWRLLLINFLKELSAREFSFQRTRAILFSLKQLPEIHSRSGSELTQWYNTFQAAFLADRSSAS